jgi:cation-dependent mannose-6-phosphate receptor
MRFWSSPLPDTLLLLALVALCTADSHDKDDPASPPCTVISPQTSNFFDLRPLTRSPPQSTDWQARGHDYGSNFSLNICAPVLSDVTSAISIEPTKQSNISAFYTTAANELYSIGSVSKTPKFRGRKLVLEYTDGSPCPAESLRKSTLMSLLCDRDLATPVISFVGQADDCAYFFEVRTAAACPTVPSQALGPVSVFGIMYDFYPPDCSSSPSSPSRNVG